MLTDRTEGMGHTMNIGQAAKTSGVSTKMIRHYESIGLINKAGRTFSGYRTYADRDVHTLRFIKRARSLGFSIEEIGKLLELWRDHTRTSAEVKTVAQTHIVQLQQKIREMQEMVDTLSRLADQCHGDHRPDCPILDALEHEVSCHQEETIADPPTSFGSNSKRRVLHP